jgi:hypothetical protein
MFSFIRKIFESFKKNNQITPILIKQFSFSGSDRKNLTINPFPPEIPFESNIMTLTNLSYGNGTYEISDSGDFSIKAYHLYTPFVKNHHYNSNRVFDIWYPYSYKGINNTSGTPGIWSQIKFPFNLIVSSISIFYHDYIHSIGKFQIFGSNDNIIWITVSEIIFTQYNINNYKISNYNSYLYYRLVIMNGHGSQYVNIFRIIWYSNSYI